jgi:hypothetical protein
MTWHGQPWKDSRQVAAFRLAAQIQIGAVLSTLRGLYLCNLLALQAMLAGQWIERDPRFFSERLYSGQFQVLYFIGVQLLMSASYHAGFTQ